MIEPGAQADIFEIKDWYHAQRSGLEFEFTTDLKSVLTLVSQNPFIFQLRYKTLRVALLKRFPYHVYYFISENIIHVIAVLHAKQNYFKHLKLR